MLLALGGVFTSFYAASELIRVVVSGIIIVAIKKPDGRMVFNPEGALVIEPGDRLITLGHRQQLDRLEAAAGA